jgi:hypothetical protein
MPTEVLACPSCLAPGPTGPDANAEYLCIYCGTRFHRPQAAKPAAQPVVVNVAAPAQRSGSAVAVVLGAVATLLVALGAVMFMTLRGSPASPPVSATPSSVRVASPPATATPSSSPPASVSVPVSVEVPVAEVPPPEPEVPATATFEFHRTQAGYQTSFYALGYVTNTSPFVIDKPKVNVVLLDADGKEVGTDEGYAQRDVLSPDERSAIKILVQNPPPHEKLAFEIVPRKASYIPVQAEGLRVEANPPRPAAFGDNNFDVDGKVFNEGSKPAKFVQIMIEALDADGKLVGVGETFADGEVLAPGGSARFKTMMMLAGKPDRFEFTVSNRVAD